VGGQYQPPGLTLDKDESDDEGVSGINVRLFVGGEGREVAALAYIVLV